MDTKNIELDTDKKDVNEKETSLVTRSDLSGLDEIRKQLDTLDEQINNIVIPSVNEQVNKENHIQDDSEDRVSSIKNSEEVFDRKTKETASLVTDNRVDYNSLESLVTSEKKKKSHWLRNTVLILLILFIAGYAGASYYFYEHFYQHTTIWGQDCSFKTADEVKDLVNKSIQTYQITLNEREQKSEVLTATQLGLDLLDDGTIENLLDSQKCYEWVRFFFEDFDYHKEVNLNLQDEKLLKNVNALQAKQEKNIVAPADAYYTYSKKDKRYVIIPEVYGNTIQNDVFLTKLKEAILLKEDHFNLEEHGCYVEPKIKKDNKDLVHDSTALNEYLATCITYDFDDRKEVVDADLLKNWISLNDKKEVVLSKKKVEEYVTKLADKYNTYGRERNFTSISGNEITVDGGSYGWKINEEKEYKKLLSLIKKHKVTTRTPIYSKEAKSRKKNDLGNTYIEIDLGSQHLWYYKKGETLVSTPVVTGDISKGRGTPTGVYYILYKQTDHVLRGPGYASHVDFWMPFIDDRGIGIHDSSWRGSYGGNIFRGHGSHGCVNTPRSAVSEIFNNVESGCPVVVHW